MTAITIADLNNAKLDVDHIAALATSSAQTTTDRLGNTKRTMAGALAEYPNAFANAAAAAASASDALTSKGIAVSAKEAAEAARDAALIQAGVYPDEPTGRAAVADGAAFKVQGSGDIAAYEYRRVNSTTSELISTYPSNEAVTGRVARRTANTNIVPVVAIGGDLAMWHDGGGIDFFPSPNFANRLPGSGSANAWKGTPLITFGGDVVLGADDLGRLIFKFSPSVLQDISDAFVAAFPSLAAPPVTNGQYLHRTRAKIAAIRYGSAGARLNILINGDSWTTLGRLRPAINAVLAPAGVVDEGYISASPSQSKATGFTQTYSAGWALVDGTAGGLDYGVTPDGQCAHTTSATETLVFTLLRCTRFSVYCRNYGGTWRYRVDGGSWTAVTDTSDGALKRVQITGLSDTTHTIDVDTTGNTGRVVLAGFYANRDGVGGVQISRIGDGGSTSATWQNYLPATTVVLGHEPPDLIITVLGTNDARNAAITTSVYLQYMTNLLAAARSNLSDTDCIHIIGPQNNFSVERPTTDYRDALWQQRDTLKSEYLSLSEYFGTWAQANALALWADDVHPSETGSRMISDLINDNFTRI